MRLYRKATPEDDFEIARISIEGWKHAYEGIMPDDTLNALDADKRAEERGGYIKENPLSSVVCLEAGKPVGFIDYEKCRDSDCDNRVGEVWAIYVLPERIGKGIGKELFSKALTDFSRQGFHEARVWVLSENKLARDFYERQGFTTDGAQKEYQGLLEVRYRKAIEPAEV
ncbi:GNAT family N-acetyltransferase [Sansalvadorimonas verongulae]|uniref:GNAT family N-acetyltransferase n=1 Tax=Sansalvadorimonas verongulae TaxID=2172824 RepID=UPI0012BB6E11|nr:GNAT family N-acetyltransferase [Sansalvadorimonas verongulae]MTI14970.1 GNAT family N-acetyltransferase [Sansalvadorimonas verongulae]